MSSPARIEVKTAISASRNTSAAMRPKKEARPAELNQTRFSEES
jgi:hypothetical protein